MSVNGTHETNLHVNTDQSQEVTEDLHTEDKKRDDDAATQSLLVQFHMTDDSSNRPQNSTKKILIAFASAILLIVVIMVVILLLYLFVFSTSSPDGAIQATSDEYSGEFSEGSFEEGIQNVTCSSIGYTNCSKLSQCILPSDDNSTVLGCQCMPGYRDDSHLYDQPKGTVCTETCSAEVSLCENGGACIEVAGNYTMCSCQAEYDGSYCEIKREALVIPSIDAASSSKILSSAKFIRDSVESFKQNSWSKITDPNNRLYQVWSDSRSLVGYPHFTIDLGKRYSVMKILVEWTPLPMWSNDYTAQDLVMEVGGNYLPCEDTFSDEAIVCPRSSEEESKQYESDFVKAIVFTCRRWGTSMENVPRKLGGFQHIRLTKAKIYAQAAVGMYRTRILNALEYRAPERFRTEPKGPRSVTFENMNSLEYDWDTTALFAVTSPAEPVAWNPVTRLPFVMASRIGLGRLMVQTSGNFAYFFTVLEAVRRGFVQKGFAWLSGGSLKGEVVGDATVAAAALSNETTNFYCHLIDPRLSAESVQQLMQLMREGRANLYLFTRGEETSSWRPLLRAAGILTPRKAKYVASLGSPVDPSSVYLSNPVPTLDEFLTSVRQGDDLALLEGGSHAFSALEVLAEEFEGAPQNDPVYETAMKWRSYLNANIVKLNQRFRKIVSLPCSTFLCTSIEDKSAAYAYNQYLLLSHFKEGATPVVDEAAQRYMTRLPANFPPTTALKERKLVNVTLTLVTRFEHEIHSTGWYLARGGKLSLSDVKVSGEGVGDHDWTIRIGCWSFHLSANTATWSRLPEVSVTYSIERKLPIYSSLGGNILFENTFKSGSSSSSNYTGQVLTITLSGDLLEAPFFDALDAATSMKKWDDMRNRSLSEKSLLGPWTEVRGVRVSFCLPSDRSLTIAGTNVSFMQTFWDDSYRSDFALLDLDWYDSQLATPQRVVLDPQPAHGYGQSGYPIVVVNDLNWFQYALDRDEVFRRGTWGVSHEIGHNLEKYMLAWPPISDIHNNLLTVWNRVNMTRLPLFGGEGAGITTDYVENVVKNYLGNTQDLNALNEWKKDVFLGLALYCQLVDHFGFGLFSHVFRNYHSRYSVVPDSTTRKLVTGNVTLWVESLSQVAQVNLVPLFRVWHVVFPRYDAQILHTQLQVEQGLPCFLPKDKLMAFVPQQRLKRVLGELNTAPGECVFTAHKSGKVPFPYPDLG